MRALWSGELAFGLVTIPVKLYTGTRDLTPRFHLIHRVCGTPVKQVRRCPKCDRDVPWDEIEKRTEVSPGVHARFTRAELAEAEAGESGTKGVIEIAEFVDPADVDPSYVEQSYWLGPGGKSAHGFLLLRTVLERSRRAALARITIRTRPRLALVRPRDHLFALDTLRFADEIVPAKDVGVPLAKAPADKELKLATALVDQLTATFDPAKHPDTYRARIAAMARARAEAEPAAEGETKASRAQGAKVVDLSELLARSLAANGAKGANGANGAKKAKPTRAAKAGTRRAS